MHILVVEDDYIQANWVCGKLKHGFPRSKIERISTELEFRSHLEDIASSSPSVVVMDVMLPWTIPSEDMQTPPDDVRVEGKHRAGLRCKELLSKDARTEDIPVILYTVFERADLESELQDMPPNVIHLRKESDPEPLFRLIRDLVKRRQQ